MNQTLVVFESIFCDYEFNSEIRKKFLHPWMESIRQLSRLSIPKNVSVNFVLYISTDKIDEIKTVTKLISELQDLTDATFKLVTYEHPPEGYGYDNAKHPDLRKNPNKVAPHRDRLFDRAISGVEITDYSRIIRMALDDDDFLLKWQLDEILRASDKAFQPDKIVAVGMPNQIVSYIEPHRADVVNMTHQLNGTKFYISSTDLFEKQKHLSPWSIPEHFNEKNVSRMAKAGVALVTVQDNVPGLVYCRWGHNLSLHDKSAYYTNRFQQIEFDSTDTMLSKFEAEISAKVSQFRNHPTPVVFHHPSDQSSTLSTPNDVSKFRIWLQGKEVGQSGRIVAVFRNTSGGTTATNLAHSGSRFIGSIPSLRHLNHDYVGFLQLRSTDGSRKQISTRAKLRFTDQIAQFDLNELLSPVDEISESRGALFEKALGMLSWLDSPHSRNHLTKLVNDITQIDYQVPPNSLLQFAFEATRGAPNKFTESVFSHLWSHQLIKSHGANPPKLRKTPLSKTSDFPSSWANFAHQWDSTDHFLGQFQLEDSMGIHRIATNSFPIDFQIDGTPSKPLVVVLHGRKAPEVKLPYLSGSGLTSDIEVSRLSISDPSLYMDPKLSISWFTGNSQQPNLQQLLVSIVKKVASALKAPRVIFVGGSAGGFASMVLSHGIDDSIALIWNPQTEVFKYHKNFVHSYLETCWPDGRDSIPDSVSTSVIDLYASKSATNLVLYMQETSDDHHVVEHLQPFESKMKPSSNILTYKAHWGNGHSPAPKPLLKEIIFACLTQNPTESAIALGFRTL